MDAVEYIKAKTRMCIVHRCGNCPLGKAGNELYYTSCRAFEEENPKESVEIVEKWSAEHPVKTRQSEFLKIFPNAKLDEYGLLYFAPCDIDAAYKPREGCAMPCGECRKEYWNEEVE